MKKPFFGWYLLAALTITYAITNGLILNSLPIFYPELVEGFGWNQAEVTRPALLLFVLVAFLSPFVGGLLDKFSVRVIMLAGAVLCAVGIYLFGSLSSLTEMTLIYGLFSVGIVLCGIISSMFLLTRWFVRYRGLAVGVFLVGSSLGGAIFNPIAASFIESMGWRDAAATLALIAAALLILPILFFVRNSPADMGLQPDGITSPNQDLPPTSGMPAVGVTLSQALRSRTFYLIILVTTCMWFTILAVVQHQALYFKDLGGDLPAGKILSLFFICSVIGKLLFGWLSDRFSKKHIMQLATINMVLGALLLYFSNRHPQTFTWVYAVVFGIGFSGTFTMIQLLVAEYYSGPSYGRILGTVTMLDTLAGVLGIMFLGQLRASSGTYQPGFLLMLALCTISAVAIPFLKNPAVREEEVVERDLI